MNISLAHAITPKGEPKTIVIFHSADKPRKKSMAVVLLR